MGSRAAGRDRASVFRLREELLADVTGALGRNYVTGALGINVTASNRVYWRSKPFTGIVPVTGSVKLPVMLQCVPFSRPERIMSPPHCCIPLCIQRAIGQVVSGQAATAADGRRAQTAGRRYAIAYQTVPPTPPDATTPALLPSRNQRPRFLSALCAGRTRRVWRGGAG